MSQENRQSETRTRRDYPTIDSAFPPAKEDLKPCGERVLFQLRSPKKMSAGGIILPGESQETEIWNTQVAKVIRCGPVAFRNRETLEPWPEGDWVKPGDFVRIPKYGGDRWWVPTLDPNLSEMALYVLMRDKDIQGVVEDPLEAISYL